MMHHLIRPTTVLAFSVAFLCPSPSSIAQSKRTYELVSVIEVAGRQGIATDGQHYFVSGSKALYVYDKSGKLIQSNQTPFAKLTKRANHLGDISYFDGELYAGIEWFEDGRGKDIQIAVYDAETLEFKRALPWKAESGQVEVSALAVDAFNQLVWMTDWVNGNYVYRYDLKDGSYKGKLHLRPVPQWQQGIAAFDRRLYLTADDGNADRKEMDNLYSVRSDSNSPAAYVQHEYAFAEFKDLGEIEGIDINRNTRELIVLHNRGKQIVLGMPKGFYPGYDREISELYIYRIK